MLLKILLMLHSRYLFATKQGLLSNISTISWISLLKHLILQNKWYCLLCYFILFIYACRFHVKALSMQKFKVEYQQDGVEWDAYSLLPCVHAFLEKYNLDSPPFPWLLQDKTAKKMNIQIKLDILHMESNSKKKKPNGRWHNGNWRMQHSCTVDRFSTNKNLSYGFKF